MFKTHLLVAIRSIYKNKLISTIHIVGLVAGITCGTLVLHYVRLENSVDKFHDGYDNIYRVATSRYRDGVEVKKYATTWSGVAPALSEDISGIESVTRMVHMDRAIVTYGEDRFAEKELWFVDSSFFEVFSFPVISGRVKDQIKNPGTVLIEESTAARYFGQEDPIGKQISIGSGSGITNYEIGGVVKCPSNSRIRFTFLISYDALDANNDGDYHRNGWRWIDFFTYIRLKEGTNVEMVRSALPETLLKYRGDKPGGITLQTLEAVYFQPDVELDVGKTGNRTLLSVMFALGIIIILIAWLNYVNLFTSRLMVRAREVGVRKTLGSTQWDLVSQFIVETAVLNMAASMLCVLTIYLIMPQFSSLTGLQIDPVTFIKGDLWIYMLGSFVIGTLLIGIYPSVMLSSFKPVQVLKGLFVSKSRGIFFRESFVVFQAFISCSLVAIILVINAQINFMKEIDLGFELNNMLIVPAPEGAVEPEQFQASLESFRQALMDLTGVTGATLSTAVPGDDPGWTGAMRRESEPLEAAFFCYRLSIGENYFDDFRIPLLTGRVFQPNNDAGEVIINEAASLLLGYENPEDVIGQRIIAVDTLTVIGVVKNSHYQSPKKQVQPLSYQYHRDPPRYLCIKYSSGDVTGLLARVRQVHDQSFPNSIFDYYFLDDAFDAQYNSEHNLMSIIFYACILAIVVSSLGLLGLTLFRLESFRKEFAIRKTLGASGVALFAACVNRIIRFALIGCLAALPITWYGLGMWLEGYASRMTPPPLLFIAALMISLLIAFAIISGFTIRLIMSNPVRYLRED